MPWCIGMYPNHWRMYWDVLQNVLDVTNTSNTCSNRSDAMLYWKLARCPGSVLKCIIEGWCIACIVIMAGCIDSEWFTAVCQDVSSDDVLKECWAKTFMHSKSEPVYHVVSPLRRFRCRTGRTTSGIVNSGTGSGYLVRTDNDTVRTGTYLVQTGTGNV